MTEHRAGLERHAHDVTVVCGVIEYGGKILFTAIACDNLQEVRWVEKHEVLQSLDENYARMLPPELTAFFEVSP